MPRGTDARQIRPGQPDATGYLVQNGPFATDTHLHAGARRHDDALGGQDPADAARGLRPAQPLRHGQRLAARLRRAEPPTTPGRARDRRLGGRRRPGDLGDQPSSRATCSRCAGCRCPTSTRWSAKGVDGTTVELDGRALPAEGPRPFPQARNGIPNPAYDGGKGYMPVGAVSTHQVEEGGRCQGNINCVPLCPVQAKYNAGKTLAKALQTGPGRPARADGRLAGPRRSEDGRVTRHRVQGLRRRRVPEHTTGTVRGRVFVLAANAIENAAADARLRAAEQQRAGRPQPDGPRLPAHLGAAARGGRHDARHRCTGGIVDLRAGPFRRDQAAFAVDIHNDGWGWATGSPYTDLIDARRRRRTASAPTCAARSVDRISRQLLLAFMIEVLPEPEQPGHGRPRATPTRSATCARSSPTRLPEYTMRGVAYARQFSRRLFQRLGAADHTSYDPADPAYVVHEGEGYVIRGGNHLAGHAHHGQRPHRLGGRRPPALVGPRQPLPGRRRQHADDRHRRTSRSPSLRCASAPPSTSGPSCDRAGGPAPDAGGGRRGTRRDHHRRAAAPLPAGRAAARARDDPAVPDGALLDPARDQRRRLPRPAGRRGGGDAPPDPGREPAQRGRRHAGPDRRRTSSPSTRPTCPTARTTSRSTSEPFSLECLETFLQSSVRARRRAERGTR